MTPDVCAKIARDLRHRTDAMAQALTDFRAQPVYRRLAGTPGAPKADLTGLTAQRTSALTDRVCELFDWLGLLYALLDRADKAILAGHGIFQSADRSREAEALLTGPSIELPSGHSTPLMVLDNLALGVDWVQKTTAEIDDSWQTLSHKLHGAETEAAAMCEMFPRADANAAHQLESIHETIGAARLKIDRDPLAARQDFIDGVEAPLATLRQILDEAARVRKQAERSLAAAGQTFQQLTTAASEARTAIDEAQAKVSQSAAANPPDQASINALGQWLTTLHTKLDEGLEKPVLVGVEHWTEKARILLREADASLQANRALVLGRRELRGRLQALKAKAVARGAVEDPRLTKLAEDATALLYAQPTPMPQAEKLVGEYEKVLNER